MTGSVQHRKFRLGETAPVNVARVAGRFFSGSVTRIVFTKLTMMFISNTLSISATSHIYTVRTLRNVEAANVVVERFLQRTFFFVVYIYVK